MRIIPGTECLPEEAPLVSRVEIDGSVARLVHEDLTIEVGFLSQPIAEGRNGATVEDLLAISQKRLEQLNTKLPCGENEEAIKHIASAIALLEQRMRDRVERNVEGTDNL